MNCFASSKRIFFSGVVPKMCGFSKSRNLCIAKSCKAALRESTLVLAAVGLRCSLLPLFSALNLRITYKEQSE